MSGPRMINYIALPVLLAATMAGLYWVWGLLFIWWVVPAIMSGQALLVFEINSDEDPFLYWAVTVLWAVLGLMLVAASLFPQYAHLLT